MATNTITPDKVKTFLSTFLSSTTKENKTHKNDQAKTDENKKATVLSPVEAASKADYFKRVETFSPMTWFGKPIELSPLVCARFGWENSMNDMLQCVSCKAVVCAKLPSTTEFSLYKEACNKLHEKLVSGHEKLCWLGANPISEKFMILSLYDVVELRKEFHEHLCQLATIKQNLPQLNFENMAKWGFDEEKCVMLATSQSIREDASYSATLAITGWTLSNSNNILVCDYCKRRIGLWNYSKKMKKGNEEIKDAIKLEGEEENLNIESKEDDVVEPTSKRMKMDKKQALDPILEHRYWCPWVTLTEKTDSEPTDEKCFNDSISSTSEQDVSFTFKKNESCPGWVNVLKLLVPSLAESVRSTGLSNSPMIEGLRSVRKILRVWSSPEKPVKHTTDTTDTSAV